jgi:hypothetical protein
MLETRFTMSRSMRHDPVAGKRLRNAAYLFGAAMFGMFAALAWSLLTAENGQAKDAPALAIAIMFLLVVGAAVNVFVAYSKLRWWYRCPQCRAHIPRPPETKVGDRIRYVCTACDVEWDTRWEVIQGGDRDSD